MEEYTKNKGVGQLAKPEEQFTVTVQFDKKFGPGQWVEFIPIDLNGFTINSSNRPDERAGSNTAILLPLEPRSKVEDRDKLDKKRKKKLSDK